MDNVSEHVADNGTMCAEGITNGERIAMRLQDITCRLAAQELQIPDGEPVACFTLDGGTMRPEWAGYHFEFVGLRTEDGPDDWKAIYAEKDGVRIRVRRMRVRNYKFQAFLEAQALPGYVGFASINLMDLDIFDRAGNAEILANSLKMLYERNFRQGRPRGSGRFANADEFYTEYERVLAHMKRENIRPTPDLIAYHLGVSRSTFYDYRRKYGLPD